MVGNFNGKAGIQFFTQIKTITTNWRHEETGGAISTSMPILK